MRCIPSCVLAILGTALVAAEDAAPAPVYSNVTTRSLPLVVDDLSKVASARLYVTADRGATWSEAESITVLPGLTPRFTFTAPADGVYGFASAVTYADGTREAEPQPGTIPDQFLYIDTKAPSIDSFEVKPVERAAGHLQLRLAWTVADDALKAEPVTIEVSLDGGASFAPLKKGGMSGNLLAPLAVPAGATMAHVRLSVTDAAGNLAVSPTTAVPLDVAVAAPTPADVPADTAALAAALAALPTVETPAQTPAAKPTRIVAPEVDPHRPDVVVPEQPAATAETPADIQVIRGGGTDAELAALREVPAAGTDWQNRGRTTAAPTDADVPPATASTPAAAPAKLRRDPLMPPGIPPAGVLSPAQANELLAAAREAANQGHMDVASARYRRLRDSHLGEGAILEEIRLYRESGEVGQARAVITGLKPGQRSEPVIIEEARCLSALGRHPDAITLLTGIKADGPNAAEAFYVIAQTFQGMGRTAEATKLFQHVAKGTGPWADAARIALGGK